MITDRKKRKCLKTVQVVLTNDLVSRLDAEAELHIDSRSRLIRQAVQEFLDRRNRALEAKEAV